MWKKDPNHTKTIFSKFGQRSVAKFRMKQRNFAKLTPQKFMGHSQNQTQLFCLYLPMLQTTTRSLLWWDMRKIHVRHQFDIEAFLRSRPYRASSPRARLDERYSTWIHPTIFVTILQSSIYNICKYKQNHCICFRERPINFWGVNFAKFHCFIRNFATERCPNFEIIVFVWFESPSSTYPIFSFIGVFLT